MRVVAGSLRGRIVKAVPGTGTRPTSDRVREAMFASLGGEIEGARVLDLFAGSGALGIEALSRGAAWASFVESDRAAAGVIRSNLAQLGLAGLGRVHQARAEALVSKACREPFDLAFLDPPYATPLGFTSALLDRLLRRGWLREGALVVLEGSARREGPSWPEGLTLLWSRRYGDTALHFARVTEILAGASP